MADKSTGNENEVKRSREVIGQGIIDGLLRPVDGVAAASTYGQTSGGYWQGSGGTHTQGSGDYHQGVVAAKAT